MSLDAVPLELRALRGWLLWKYVPGAPGSKPRKVPYYADGRIRAGKQGSPADRAKLVTFDQALDVSANYSGIGLAMLPEHNLVALDFDNCVTDDGLLDPTVQTLVEGTYAEWSPSGRGVRALFTGALPNNKSAASGQHAFGFETFCSTGFVTITGQHLPDADLVGVAQLPDYVRAYCGQRFGRKSEAPAPSADSRPKVGLSLPELGSLLERISPDTGYQQWVDVLMAVHFETDGSPEGLDLVDAWSANGADYAGRDMIEQKWASFGQSARGNPLTGVLLQHRATPLNIFEDLTTPTAEALDSMRAVPLGDFLRDLKDQHYVWENVLARNNLYALTARWGHGKTALMLTVVLHVAAGRKLCGHEIEASKVLYLCGENPDDVRLRVTAALAHFGISREQIDRSIFFTRRPFAIDKPESLRAFVAANAPLGPFGLLVIDTGPAHSEAEDENSNREAHKFAIAIRDLMQPLGNPATVLLMHPAKAATRESLEPRGGSAMAGSIDGELCAWQEERGDVIEFFHRSKLRGPGFAPMFFRLEEITLPGLKTNFGKPVTTVVAVETSDRPAAKASLGGRNLRQSELDLLAAYHSLVGPDGGAVRRDELIDAIRKKDPDKRRNVTAAAVDKAAEKGLIRLAMSPVEAGGAL